MVFYWSLTEIGVLICMGCFQIYFLKRYLKSPVGSTKGRGFLKTAALFNIRYCGCSERYVAFRNLFMLALLRTWLLLPCIEFPDILTIIFLCGRIDYDSNPKRNKCIALRAAKHTLYTCPFWSLLLLLAKFQENHCDSGIGLTKTHLFN